ncbi:F-box/WD repeat-containing protein 5-like isoform X2 [Oculina patagonica]
MSLSLETLKSAIIEETNPSLSDGSLENSHWTDIPDNLLLQIFCFLSPKEVLLAGEVCRNWHRLSKDELLWKSFLKDTLFNAASSKNIELPNLSSSWLAEYQRIHINTPFVESQVLKEHTDEVLHVAFSQDGQLLATCSKDCCVILWRVDDYNRVSIAQKENVQKHNSLRFFNVLFSEFNASDTLLLVSGAVGLWSGKIVIYNLQGCSMVRLVHKSVNDPYAFFGTCLSERCYVSVTAGVNKEPAKNDDRRFFSQLWANNVDETKSKLIAQVVQYHHLSVTLVHVAMPNISSQSTALQRDDSVCLIFTHEPHQIMLKWIKLPHDLNNHGERDDRSSEIPAGAYGSCSRPDHCIKTNGRIIGISLSPDHQYLYVNYRPFPQQNDECSREKAHSYPPEITNDIIMQVYSLSTYELVGVHTGHQGYTNKYDCAFIYADVAEKLVARSRWKQHPFVMEER